MKAAVKVRPIQAEGGEFTADFHMESTVEVQLLGGHPTMGLTPVLHVTGETLLSAPAVGPGTYTLWCAPTLKTPPLVVLLLGSLDRVSFTQPALRNQLYLSASCGQLYVVSYTRGICASILGPLGRQRWAWSVCTARGLWWDSSRGV